MRHWNIMRQNIDKVTGQLGDEGVRKFSEPFGKLMETLFRREVDDLLELKGHSSAAAGRGLCWTDIRG